VEIGKGSRRRAHDALDQRHQRFGVSAHHDLRFLRRHPGAGAEHRRRAGLKRGIDGEDAHAGPRSSSAKADDPVFANSSIISQTPGILVARSSLPPRKRGQGMTAYIGRTSTTSGTKCLSKFWMPCLSVAVEDGQPEQAPFMCRKTTPSL